MVLITIVTGAYKPTYNWGASHCGDSHDPNANSAAHWMLAYNRQPAMNIIIEIPSTLIRTTPIRSWKIISLLLRFAFSLPVTTYFSIKKSVLPPLSSLYKLCSSLWSPPNGGFLSHEVTPKSSKSWKHFSIETRSLGDSPLRKPHVIDGTPPGYGSVAPVAGLSLGSRARRCRTASEGLQPPGSIHVMGKSWKSGWRVSQSIERLYWEVVSLPLKTSSSSGASFQDDIKKCVCVCETT